MTAGPVRVWVDEGSAVEAGTLFPHRRGRSQSATFSYTGEHLAREDAYSLDPALPLVGGALQTPVGVPLFGAMADAAPDRWGRTLLDRSEMRSAREQDRAPRSLDEVDYLLGVRDDLRQGALRFSRGRAPFLAEPDSGVPALTDLPALLALADRAEDDRADLGDLQRLVQVGSSLGGARPKAHVRTADGHVAIAKFPSRANDTWDVMAWEKVALHLAEVAGITVPSSTLLDLAGRRVLVVDRFDRGRDGSRTGYASAMTMLEARDGDRRTYLEIAGVVEERSAHATDELHELWRRIVLTVLVSNTDDHLRNHGFLHERVGVWRLAPAFDLNPDPQAGPTYLSTDIDGSGSPATLQAALGVCGLFRLSPAAARSIIGEVAAAVGTWRAVASSYGLSPRQLDAMAPAFSALDDAAAP